MEKTLANVVKVYNGKIGCMCGCNGKYKVATAHREQADKNRGYPYSDEDISDRSVKIIFNKVMKNPNRVEEGNYVFVEDKSAGYAGRIQVVYFKETLNA